MVISEFEPNVGQAAGTETDKFGHVNVSSGLIGWFEFLVRKHFFLLSLCS